MGKKCGHGDHHHRHHEMGPDFSYYGMGPMPRMTGHHWNTCDPRMDFRIGCSMKREFQTMSDPNWNKAAVQCTLCWRRIRPLVETEVLECGHIYHRLCLKELFAVSQSGETSEIYCTQCRQQIDTNLVTELQKKFNTEPTTGPKISDNGFDML